MLNNRSNRSQVFYKRLFFSQNSQQITCVAVSFLKNCRPRAACSFVKRKTPAQVFPYEFYKKETPVWVFSHEFCESFKNAFL